MENSVPEKLTIADIEGMFPNVFGDKTLPLKIGIYKDLRIALGKRGSVLTIKRVIAKKVYTTKYLETLTLGGYRFDLDGNPAGTISELDIKDAISRLALKRKSSNYSPHALVKNRSKLLKDFDSARFTNDILSLKYKIPLDELEETLNLARAERETRYQDRLKLVQDFNTSGLSLDEFSEVNRVPKFKLEKAIQKVQQRNGAS